MPSNSQNNICLEVHNLSVFYGKQTALWELDFSLEAGQKIGIMGPNGSGKSTLIKTIMGLIEPASGYVKVFGETLNSVRSKISYVPQKESVDWDFPVTVQDVVEMGRYKPKRLFGRLSQLDKDLAKQAMEKLKIEDLANRHISELSGGQQQRVFLARAIAQDASLYFMDEPFTGVDAATEQVIMELCDELIADGKTVIMVHHDLNTAPQYFDHIVLLNTRLIAEGKIEETFTAKNIAATYGAQLDILAEFSSTIQNQNLPVREKGHKEE